MNLPIYLFLIILSLAFVHLVTSLISFQLLIEILLATLTASMLYPIIEDYL